MVPILTVLAPRIVERMARDAVCVTVPAGKGVAHQGDVGTRFYVIASGLVRVDIDGERVRELGPATGSVTSAPRSLDLSDTHIRERYV